MAAKKDKRIASATFLTSLLDFSRAGELGVFIDEEQVANARKEDERARLSSKARRWPATFNMLRANDLIWSFVINNYLMGKDPFPFDLLYWNSDSTRMPATMHSFYLRNMYMKNLLSEPGGITLDGVPIDLGKVKMPAYFISTVEDHIAPWKIDLQGRAAARRQGRASCSAAPATSPASSTRRRRTSTATGPTTKLPADAGRVARGRHAARGLVVDRLAGVDGRRTAAARCRRACPGKGKLKVIEDAPGSFVRTRADGR